MMSGPGFVAAVIISALATAFAGCTGDERPPEWIAETKASDFAIRGTHLNLPAACALSPATERIVTFVRAFNTGDTQDAVRAFDRTAELLVHEPPTPAQTGRDEIAEWLEARHRRGEGWTLFFIWAPTGRAGLPLRTFYSVGVRVSRHGKVVLERGAQAVIDCKTGLILTWLGPRYGPD